MGMKRRMSFISSLRTVLATNLPGREWDRAARVHAVWAMGGMSRAPGQGVVASLCVKLPERPDFKPHLPPPSFPQWPPAPVVARYEEDAAALSWRWQQSQCLAAGEGEQVVAGGQEGMKLKEVRFILSTCKAP